MLEMNGLASFSADDFKVDERKAYVNF